MPTGRRIPAATQKVSNCRAVMEGREERHLLRLLGLGLEAGGGTLALEVAGEDGLEEGAEDNLGAASLGESHPEDEDELEGVVEWEPVNSVDSALEDGQEGIDDPVSQPLSVIGSGGREQRTQRVVGGDGEADGLDEEVGRDVEEDEEEIEGSETEHYIDLGHIGLLLEVCESGVFVELAIKSRQMLRCLVLERHFELMVLVRVGRLYSLMQR